MSVLSKWFELKRLVITNDCDGATLETMRQAQERFEKEYGLPFSESCWIFSESGVSLLDYEVDNDTSCKCKHPDYDFLVGLIKKGKIDTLHTWGDFPDGGFNRTMASLGYSLLEKDQVKFTAWTAHGGVNDFQNLSPLGLGDCEGSEYYHMDYTQKLGIRFFCRNTDIDVSSPSRQIIADGRYFRRFRGPTKQEAYVINLQWLPRQIELAEKKSMWHRSPSTVILYTHFYAEEDKTGRGSRSVEEFTVPDGADQSLRELAERRDRGELEILRLSDVLAEGC